jgi:RimJ/RimL family protein N-acetyltransferase
MLAHAHGADERFAIVAGLCQPLVRSLQERSLDTADSELTRRTSDPVRFGEGSYEAWFRKGRFAFALVNVESLLAALVWYGPSHLPTEVEPRHSNGPDTWDTVAFRSYPPYRGRGLMGDFSRFVFRCHSLYSPERRLWLETDADNLAGLRLYEALGFRIAGSRRDGGRVVMIKE